MEKIEMWFNPSKRFQYETFPRTTECKGCKWQTHSDPTERPCNECTRSTYFDKFLKQSSIPRHRGMYWKDYWRSRVFGGEI